MSGQDFFRVIVHGDVENVVKYFYEKEQGECVSLQDPIEDFKSVGFGLLTWYCGRGLQ